MYNSTLSVNLAKELAFVVQIIHFWVLLHSLFRRMEFLIPNLVICLFIAMSVNRAVSSETGKFKLRSSETCECGLIDIIILFIWFVLYINSTAIIFRKRSSSIEESSNRKFEGEWDSAESLRLGTEQRKELDWILENWCGYRFSGFWTLIGVTHETNKNPSQVNKWGNLCWMHTATIFKKSIFWFQAIVTRRTPPYENKICVLKATLFLMWCTPFRLEAS